MKQNGTKVKKISNWVAKMLCIKDSPFKTKIVQSKKKYNRKKKVDFDDNV